MRNFSFPQFGRSGATPFGGGRSASGARGDIVAAIDLGASKVACFIARIAEGPGRASVLEPIGFGHNASSGLKCGAIVDMAAAEESVRAAVEAAERMAGRRIRRATVGLAGGALSSRSAEIEVDLGGYAVAEDDLEAAIAHGVETCTDDRSEILHLFASRYCIDGLAGVRDPVDLAGDRLTFRLHAILADAKALQNLSACVERCHLEIDTVVAAPLAASTAVLIDDERELGAVMLDMGASATGYAVFEDGALIQCGSAPIGGQAISADIACGLSTTLAHAERLKTLHGDALPGLADDRDEFEIAEIGGGPATRRASRGELAGIIRARLEETFEMLRARIETAPGRRLVLTGGASQMAGARETAARILDRQARCGRPLHVAGLAEAVSGPAFAAAAGLLQYAVFGAAEEIELDRRLRMRAAPWRLFAGRKPSTLRAARAR